MNYNVSKTHEKPHKKPALSKTPEAIAARTELARAAALARAKKYTQAERSESARQAAIARWNGERAKQLDAESGSGRRGRAGGERW